MTIRSEDIGSKEPATKGDLEQLREDLQVDMANLESRFGEKLDAWGKTLFDKLDSLIENRAVDAGAAKNEHVSLLNNEVTSLAQRVSALERKRSFE